MMPISSFEEYKKLMLESSKSKNFVSCILFVNADRKSQTLVNQILENIQHLDRRSGELITFFMPGYYQEVLTDKNYFRYFEVSSFDTFMDELEKISSWRYSEETEMLFLNMVDGEFDFSKVYDYPLETMIREGEIASFEALFRELRCSLEKYGDLGMGERALIKLSSLFFDLLVKKFPSVKKCKNRGMFLPRNYKI